MKQVSKRPGLSRRSYSQSLSTTPTILSKNASQEDLRSLKPPTSIEQILSATPPKQDSVDINKLTLLSPDCWTNLHQGLRPTSKNEKQHKSIAFLFNAAGSELGHNIPEEQPINYLDEQLVVERKEYEEYKKSFEKVVFRKDHTLARSVLRPKDYIAHPQSQLADIETERAIKKLDEKYKGFNPNILPHRPQTARHTMTPSFQKLKQHFDVVKQKKQDILESHLRGLKNDKVIQSARSEIRRVSMETAEEVSKYKFENDRLMTENKMLKEKNADLEAQNLILQKENDALHKQIVESYDKRDLTMKNYEKLEIFLNIYNLLQEKFPNQDIRSILNKYDRMQDYVYRSVKQLDDVEDEKKLLRDQVNKLRKELEAKDHRLQNDMLEVNNLERLHRRKVEGLELELSAQSSYKKEYDLITNKVNELFMECSEVLEVYHSFKDDKELNASLSTPIECLDLLKRAIKISSSKTLREYLKKIIISANLLRRKYFPQSHSDKFDPDKLYDQCSKYIESLENQIKRLTNKKV